MQIIELYIADGYIQKGASNGVSANQLISFNTNFFETVKIGAEVKNEDTGTVAFVTSIVNEVTLNLSSDIFLYSFTFYEICNPLKRLDLFKDESVSITDTVKNIKDVSKVFTPFSQQFNVPASKTNSKIFKHYSDSDILNSFDARYKAKGLIKLNGVDYKKGKISLQSVSLKNNKPHAYKLVFYGETVELKDLLAEDEISSLQFAESLNFSYSNSSIFNRFTNLNSFSDVCVPLITHTKNMRFDQNGYKSTNAEFLNFTDLKPAIRVRTIIDAIESKYPEIKFSQEFLNTEDFRSLYLWMHKQKGVMSNGDDSENSNTITGVFNTNTNIGWDFIAGVGTLQDIRPYANIYSYGNVISGSLSQVVLTFNIQMSAQNVPYSLLIRRNSDNATLFDSEELFGNQILVFIVSPYNYGIGYLDITIELISENILTLTQFDLTAAYQATGNDGAFGTTVTVLGTGFYQLSQVSTANTIIINRHLPKIKIIDFLSNLFKMFNLVVYKRGDEIRVIPLDEFYAEGLSYDITKYVDAEKSSIKKVLQYRNIRFNFTGRITYLVQKFQELLNNIFSEESYGNNDWDGSNYNVDVAFEKVMFERLSNNNTGALSTICQGATLDKDFNPVLGKPLMFYVKNQATSDLFKFEDTGSGNTVDITSYNRPSQIYVPASGTVSDNSSSLNFGSEIDEFFLSVTGKNLFSKYYQNYIESVFARQGRILNIDAYLPLNIILKYQLNDIFVISNKAYRINSVKTNLLTNKSSLELYSLQDPITNVENSQSSFLDRVGSFTETAKTETTVDVSWTIPTMPNLTGFDVMLNDNLFAAVGVGITSIKVNALIAGVSYKIAVRSKYQSGTNIGYSEDVVLFVTTDSAGQVTTEDSIVLVTELGENIIIE